MAKISPIFKRAVSLIIKKPATTKYPYVKLTLPDNYRGQMQLDNKLCIGCGLCTRDCPAGAIEMVDFYGKKRPQFRPRQMPLLFPMCRKLSQKGNQELFHIRVSHNRQSLISYETQTCYCVPSIR